MKKCKICHISFESKYKQQITCGDVCRKLHKRRWRQTYNKKWTQNNPEWTQQYFKKYYQTHKEKMKATTKQWRQDKK